MKRGVSAFNVVAVALGLAFLYLPIVILVIFSFNGSRLVTIWGGRAPAWYPDVVRDDSVHQAATIIPRVTALSATRATVLRTPAAPCVIRLARFPCPLLFSSK